MVPTALGLYRIDQLDNEHDLGDFAGGSLLSNLKSANMSITSSLPALLYK